MAKVDLGQVSAIKISSTPPSNTKIIWYDTTVTTGMNFKYYNINTQNWLPFFEPIDFSSYAKTDDLGPLSLASTIEKAMLGESILSGGYFKNELIDTNTLIVSGLVDDDKLSEAFDDFNNTLGVLSKLNIIQANHLGTTIIQNGVIKTDLIDADTIVSNAAGLVENIANTNISAAIANITLEGLGAGALAKKNLISAALLDSTIIQGGLIRTSMVDAQAIVLSGGGQTEADVNNKIGTAIGSLSLEDFGAGSLAYQDMVEEAMLGNTLMVGGYLKNDLIDTQAVVVGGGGVLTTTIIADGKIKTNLINANEVVVGGGGVLTTTIISNGKIKTNLIDVDTLIAKHIAAEDGTIAAFSIIGNTLQTSSGSGSFIIDGNNYSPYLQILSAANNSFTRIDYQGISSRYAQIKHLNIGEDNQSTYNLENAVFLNCEYIYSRHGWNEDTGEAWYGGRTGAYSADDAVFYKRTAGGPQLNVFKITGNTVSGNTVEYYTLTNLSDKRYKKNIKSLNYGLEDILKLKPVSYQYDIGGIDDSIHLGFIAQDVQNIIPEIIDGNEDRFTISNAEIIPILVKAIQDLNKKINKIK